MLLGQAARSEGDPSAQASIRSNHFWSEEEVNQKLETVTQRSIRDVMEIARKHMVPNRTAAYMLGVGRVAEATKIRGLYG